MKSSQKPYEDRKVALDFLQQLQDRGVSKSHFEEISEAKTRKGFIDNPRILRTIVKELYGQKIDGLKEASRLFPSNEKTIFTPYIKVISNRLNSVFKKKMAYPLCHQSSM